MNTYRVTTTADLAVLDLPGDWSTTIAGVTFTVLERADDGRNVALCIDVIADSRETARRTAVLRINLVQAACQTFLQCALTNLGSLSVQRITPGTTQLEINATGRVALFSDHFLTLLTNQVGNLARLTSAALRSDAPPEPVALGARMLEMSRNATTPAEQLSLAWTGCEVVGRHLADPNPPPIPKCSCCGREKYTRGVRDVEQALCAHYTSHPAGAFAAGAYERFVNGIYPVRNGFVHDAMTDLDEPTRANEAAALLRDLLEAAWDVRPNERHWFVFGYLNHPRISMGGAAP